MSVKVGQRWKLDAQGKGKQQSLIGEIVQVNEWSIDYVVVQEITDIWPSRKLGEKVRYEAKSFNSNYWSLLSGQDKAK